MAVIARGDEARFLTLSLVGELVEEVPNRGELWLHRDDARRRMVAEASVQVVRHAPLRRYRGSRPGGRRRGSLMSGSVASWSQVDETS